MGRAAAVKEREGSMRPWDSMSQALGPSLRLEACQQPVPSSHDSRADDCIQGAPMEQPFTAGAAFSFPRALPELSPRAPSVSSYSSRCSH